MLVWSDVSLEVMSFFFWHNLNDSVLCYQIKSYYYQHRTWGCLSLSTGGQSYLLSCDPFLSEIWWFLGLFYFLWRFSVILGILYCKKKCAKNRRRQMDGDFFGEVDSGWQWGHCWMLIFMVYLSWLFGGSTVCCCHNFNTFFNATPPVLLLSDRFPQNPTNRYTLAS